MLTYSIMVGFMLIVAIAFVVDFAVPKPGFKGILGMVGIGVLVCIGLVFL